MDNKREGKDGRMEESGGRMEESEGGEYEREGIGGRRRLIFNREGNDQRVVD